MAEKREWKKDEAEMKIAAGNLPPLADEHGYSERTATEARQGVQLGVMRYVLGISLALAIIAMVVTFALS